MAMVASSPRSSRSLPRRLAHCRTRKRMATSSSHATAPNGPRARRAPSEDDQSRSPQRRTRRRRALASLSDMHAPPRRPPLPLRGRRRAARVGAGTRIVSLPVGTLFPASSALVRNGSRYRAVEVVVATPRARRARPASRQAWSRASGACTRPSSLLCSNQHGRPPAHPFYR